MKELKIHKFPAKYDNARQWAKLFITRIDLLEQKFNEDEHTREYFGIAGINERAAVKRTGLDLKMAITELNKPL